MEFTLLGAALTGALGIWIGLRPPGVRQRLAAVDRPFDLLIGAAGVGVFAGRIFEMMSNGVNPLTNPSDVLLVRGGVDTVVASTAAMATVVWSVRRHLVTLDALAPAAIMGLSGWHGGCLWTGSCLGTATGTGFGFPLPGSDVLRHPTELYAAATLLIIAIVAVRLVMSPTAQPFVATGVAIAGAGAVRAMTQPLRPSLAGGPIWGYATAILAGLVVVALSRAGKLPDSLPVETGSASPPAVT